jgi:hypothetical protein
MRGKIEYSEVELNRSINYITVLCDPKIDTSIIDLEEAAAYVDKFKRRAIIISDREVFKGINIDIVKFNYVMNATTPAVRLIDNDRQQYRKVYDFILANYKNGLLVAYPETITNDIADTFAKTSGAGLDIVIYRNNLLELSGNERSRTTYMRIHSNREFILSKGSFDTVKEKYGERNTLGIFTSQFIANYQDNACRHYITENTDLYESLGKEDYINYKELNRQMAFHVYYDMNRAKILHCSKEELVFYMRMLFKAIEGKVNNSLVDKFSIIFCDE